MTFTVVFKTTTELKYYTVVKPLYMIHYYVPGYRETRNKKEKKKKEITKGEMRLRSFTTSSWKYSAKWTTHLQRNETK